MYSAVSGLKSHMNALSVIGNNVSNVNTLGYKATRYTFNEALYSTNRSGADGDTVLGGRNPGQIGYGASIGTIDLDMSSKNFSPTGKALDTMIDGDGFFIVGDKLSDKDLAGLYASDGDGLKHMDLTRLGNFTVDPNGYLVDGNGSVVWGFLETEVSNEDFYVRGLGNDENSADYLVRGITWLNQQIEASREEGSTTPYPDLSIYKNVVFDADGIYIKQATVTSNILTPVRLPKVNERTVTYEGNESYDLGAINIAYPKEATSTGVALNEDPLHLAVQVLDADEEANYRSSYDEFGEGNLRGSNNYGRLQPDTVSIDDRTGALTVMTEDEQLVVVGYLAIAKVANPEGVTHVNGRYYQAREGAGAMRLTTIGGAFVDEEFGVGTAGETGLQVGGLESSGTDLATEITNMITVQRGYQANTRIVTVTDSMLEELVNMKR